jgi:hypothetical protein
MDEKRPRVEQKEIRVLKCPSCGSEEIGSDDVILATAWGDWYIDPETGRRMFEGGGETEVHWDTQVNVVREGDNWACRCADCGWEGFTDDLLPRRERL